MRSYYFNFNLYAIVQLANCDIVTAVTEFHYVKCDFRLSAYRGVMVQWFEFTKVCMGKALIDILAETLIFLD